MDITNDLDMINSRQITERIAELRSMIEDIEDPENDLDPDDAIDYREELAMLVALEEEASGVPDWNYGATLVRDSYFEAYARQLWEETSGEREITWPYTSIDWKAAASDLQVDYMDIDFDGVTYWARA